MAMMTEFLAKLNADLAAVAVDQAATLTFPATEDAPAEDDRDWWAEETRDDNIPCNWDPDPASARKLSKAECGRLGGRATVERHGVEHMRAIGRKGFKALATFVRGGRQGALNRLVGKGRLAYFRPVHDLSAAELAEVWAMVEGPADVPPKATAAERAELQAEQQTDLARLAEGWDP